jgi:hypothetical protein
MTRYLVGRLEPPMGDTEVALVLPGALALLERDGQAVRDYTNEIEALEAGSGPSGLRSGTPIRRTGSG